ncbi:ankycorbin-like [Diabrotica virgifera virgifera]|uniref:Uncharacterized protein n=1 Tax=Diabrotica virgifera virgifera TaxID=50390 RepID=A0ABM5KXU9_DIAVI|nr:ankycorbin-like [Diabrotica virgifera virgifera]
MLAESYELKNTFPDRSHTYYKDLENNMDLIKFLIRACAIDLNLCDHFGDTPSYYAAQSNSLEIIKYLKEQGANLSVSKKDKSTLVHTAAECGALEVLRYLLEDCKMDIMVSDVNGNLPAHMAAYSGKVEILRYLKSIGIDLNQCNNTGKTLVHIAAGVDAVDVLIFLKNEYKFSENLDSCDKYGNTPSHCAAASKSLKALKQVYFVPPHDNPEVETSLIIPFDNLDHRIFLSTDKRFASYVKKPGHTASNCSTPESNQSENSNKTPSPPSDISQVASLNTPPVAPQDHNSETPNDTQKMDIDSKGAKRPKSSDSSEIEQPTNSEFIRPEQATKKATQPKKKLKRDSSIHDDCKISLESKNVIRDHYQKDSFMLPVDNFIAFLENCYGKSSPLSEALLFTKNIEDLLSDISKIHKSLTDRSLKNRLTRIIKKIKMELGSSNSDAESIIPVSSQDNFEEDHFTEGPATSEI